MDSVNMLNKFFSLNYYLNELIFARFSISDW